MIKYVYEIPVIVPLENAGMSGYNFNVNLDSELGIKAREKILEEKPLSYFRKSGIEIVQSFFGKKHKSMPYSFVENSWLVRAMCLPMDVGDACDLALSESSLRDFVSDWEIIKSKGHIPFSVKYSPHNIDSLKQAQCLRELFLNWANITNLCLNH